MYSSHLGLTDICLHPELTDICLHLELVVRHKDCPGEGDPHHDGQQQAGVRYSQVGAPGQALRGKLDESILHWTHFRPDDWG